MHELTKKELQEIFRCLKIVINSGTTPYSALTVDLKKKIHLMIDHYDAKTIEAWHCEKCGHVQ